MGSRTWIAGTAVFVAAWVAPAATDDPRVIVKAFKFRPDTLAVAVGDSVTWANDDEIEHTVTSDSTTSRLALDGLLVGKGTRYRVAFRRPGTYAYHCERHQFMTGVLKVTSSGDKP